MQTRLNIAGLVVLVFALLTAWLVVPAAPARAELADAVSVALTEVTPTVLTNHGDLVISGQVTNQTDAPIAGTEVRLWRDATPLTGFRAMDDEQAAAQRGDVLESASTRQALPTIEPGQSTTFTVRTALGPNAVEQSWLSQPDAAYRVGVEVRDARDQQRLGRATTLIAYPGSQPVPFGSIVLLTAKPALLPLDATADQPAVLANNELSEELSGELGQLLEVAEQPGVLSVVDPALYDAVSAMTAPYRYQTPEGTLRASTPAQQAAATDWLTRLGRLAEEQRLARSLYGSPDIAAAVASGRSDVVQYGATALPAEHPLADLPLTVVPTAGEIDQATATALQGVAPQLVLSANLPGNHLVQSAQELSLVSVLPPMPSGIDLVTARGWQLSHQLVGARVDQVQIQVITTGQQASVELEQYPWRTRQPVTELLTGTPDSQAVTLTGEQPDPVSQTLLDASDQATELLSTWGELIGGGAQANYDLSRVIASGWSTNFGRDVDAQAAWLARASAPAADLLTPDAVQLRISDWVTTSADDNLLPVTVINNAGRPVAIKVQFESENPLRISVDNSEVINVQAGESATVRVRPRTYGNGKVAITAQLATASGHPVGRPTSFVITGTEAGRVAWLIIVASGTVLLAATALRVNQVRNERKAV